MTNSNVQEFAATDRAMATAWGLKMASNGFQAILENGRACDLTTLRTDWRRQAKIEATKSKKKATKRQVSSEMSRETTARLNDTFPALNVFIRETAPGIDTDFHRFYIMCDPNNEDSFKLNVVSKQHTTESLEAMLSDYTLLRREDNGNDGSVAIGSLTYDELTTIVASLEALEPAK